MKTRQMNKSFISAAKPKSRSFTLLELIVVIVIVAVLATLGFIQYSKLVERIRLVEAKTNIGYIRERAIEYYLEHGSFDGVTVSDIVEPLPTSCTSAYYFRYGIDNYSIPPQLIIHAFRCSSGDKAPNYTDTGGYLRYINLSGNGEITATQCYTLDPWGQWLGWCAEP